jgi:hypothetical protein
MKRNFIAKILCVLVFIGAMLISSCATEARTRPTPTPTPSGPAGRLIVQRAPNFGSDLFIRLSIDGRRVADIPRNQHYGGILSAGRHTLTALALPNTQSRRPTSIRLTVQAGRVYIFTATWQSDRFVLQPSSYYSPTTRVNGR